MNHLIKDKVIWGGTAVILLLLFYTLFSERGLLKAKELANERDAIIVATKALEEDNRRLAIKTKALREDMTVIEKAARNELDLVREDEILYKFIE